MLKAAPTAAPTTINPNNLPCPKSYIPPTCVMFSPYFLINKQITALILQNYSLFLKKRPIPVLTFFLLNEVISLEYMKGRLIEWIYIVKRKRYLYGRSNMEKWFTS
ncbi:hypothetical protein LSPH24S_07588 [Lysinibacillus sphaericus]